MTPKIKIHYILAIFFLLQIPMLFTLSPSDENVYYYMGKVTADGFMPYADYFLAHPPTQIFIYAFVIKLIGVYLPLLKLVTLLFNMGSGYLVYLLAKERYGEKHGLVASFLFLSTYLIFVFGSFSTGLEMATFLFLLSMYYSNKNSALSGLYYGLNAIVRLHLLPLGIFLWWQNKDKKKFLVWSILTVGIFYGLLALVPNAFSNMFGYHLDKVQSISSWGDFARNATPLILLFLMSLNKLKDNLYAYLIISYCLFIAYMASSFEYYFIPVVAFMAIEGSNAVLNPKFKMAASWMLRMWMVVMIAKAVGFGASQTIMYSYMSDYIYSLPNGEILGGSAITSLMALTTGKDIAGLQIDTNVQRQMEFDKTGALLIYEGQAMMFRNVSTECMFVREMYEPKNFHIWQC